MSANLPNVLTPIFENQRLAHLGRSLLRMTASHSRLPIPVTNRMCLSHICCARSIALLSSIGFARTWHLFAVRRDVLRSIQTAHPHADRRLLIRHRLGMAAVRRRPFEPGVSLVLPAGT